MLDFGPIPKLLGTKKPGLLPARFVMVVYLVNLLHILHKTKRLPNFYFLFYIDKGVATGNFF